MFKIYDKFLKMNDLETKYYVILSNLCTQEVNYFTAKTLYYYIYGDEYNEAKCCSLKKELSKVLKTFGGTKIENTIYRFERSYFTNGTYYCYLDWGDVLSVLRSNIKCKRQLIKYMALIALSFDKTKVKGNVFAGFGYMPREFFSKKMGKSITTISNYTDALHNLDVLYVFNRTKKTNVYCFKSGIPVAREYVSSLKDEN